MDDAKVQLLAERALALDRIRQSPDWPALREEYQRKREKITSRFNAFALHGPQVEAVEQRELDYWRGFLDGAEWLLDNPEHAQRTFSRAFGKLKGSDD